MKKAFSLFALLWALPIFACQIKHEIISLSAPVTGVLAELELLDDSRLKGISLFHPIDKKSFKGTRFGGGVFLAQKTLKAFKDKTVFFDESGETARRLKQAGLTKTVQIKTRGLDPFEVTEKTLKMLEAHLSNCPTEVLRLRLWAANEKQYLLAQKKLQHPIYFFLGEIRGNKLPELMMVNDGPVLFWTRNDRIRSFDSTLAYVRWGEKWRRALTGQEALVGISELKPGSKFELYKGEGRLWNVKDVGALTPGPSQIRFMRHFTDTWKEKN
jgi:hypothetical protein